MTTNKDGSWFSFRMMRRLQLKELRAAGRAAVLHGGTCPMKPQSPLAVGDRASPLEGATPRTVDPTTILDPFEFPRQAALTRDEFAARIKQRIRMQTSDRIHELAVVVMEGRVELHGRCATFYTKQLAQHAAMGILEDEVVINNIEVQIGR
jgi:osmotically-inducible protein OsmY